MVAQINHEGVERIRDIRQYEGQFKTAPLFALGRKMTYLGFSDDRERILLGERVDGKAIARYYDIAGIKHNKFHKNQPNFTLSSHSADIIGSGIDNALEVAGL